MDPDYSELDFEHLANGVMGRQRPDALFTTSWRTFSPEPNWKKDNVFDTSSGSRVRLRHSTTRVTDGKVKYFTLMAIGWLSTEDKYYPRSLMSRLNFNLLGLSGRDSQVDGGPPSARRTLIGFFISAKEE